MISRQPTSGSSSSEITEFTEQDIGRYFWVKYTDGLVKLRLVKLTSERGWFKQNLNKLSIHCSKVTSLEAPEGPSLTGFSSEQLGQFFWVQREAKVKLQLVGLNARRGWFALTRGIISIHYSKVILFREDEDGDERMEQVIDDDSISSDDGLAAFTQAQLEKHSIVAKALQKALEKLKQAMSVIQSQKDHPETPFLKNLEGLLGYLERKAKALEEDEGPFRCLPNDDGPQGEVASAHGHLICLYKPFFVEGVTTSKQADYLIHEAVHSFLEVTDYAYLWQHIFRFLPLEFRLKNPDSYVAIVRAYNEEDILTPNSGDSRKDYTLGMIQHICFRGTKLLKQCETQWESLKTLTVPEPLNSLKALYSEASEETLKGYILIGKFPVFDMIVSAISSNKVQLSFDEPLPTRVDDAQGKVENGVITVQYIASTTAAPYIALLVKILMLFQLEKGKAIAIAKALDALTDRCLIPRIKEPSSL